MATVLKTLVVTLIVLIAAVLLFVYSGVYNVAADVPDSATVKWFLATTRRQSVAQRADSVQPPADLANEERIRRGAKHYGQTCQMCHLGPGVKPTPLHEGLRPKPPELVEEMKDLPPAKAFWIVKHGIKMTGMPAWGEAEDDDELWDVVAFLKALPTISPERYASLTHEENGKPPGDASSH